MLTNPPIPYDPCVGIPIGAGVGALVIVKTDGSFAALLLTRQILGNGHMVRTGNRVTLSEFSLNCGQATHNKSWPAGDRGVRLARVIMVIR